MIKTKIIATLGPSCTGAEIIKAMIDNGVDIFRLNFSHGTLDQHAEMLETLNAVRSQHRHTIAVIGDLCGPRIRTGRIDPEGQMLGVGDEAVIVPGAEVGTAERFSTNYENFNQDVRVGQRIFIDDGEISLLVVRQDNNKIVCRVIVGGPLHSHKGINLPDTEVSIPSITERDWLCVNWAIQHDLDFLALSFVRCADEIEELKSHLRRAGSNIRAIAKIEKPQAVAHLEGIVNASDAILVARGDLGVEMNLAEVPLLQKRITQMCRHLGKPVVVATQILQSMITNPVATRAEVSDVANAVMDFTDAVMLSGETAVGKYPIEAVQTIRSIAGVTEAYLDQNDEMRPKTATTSELLLTAAMTRSVAQIVDDIAAKLVVVWSQTGSAARLLSKARVDVPILALSSDRHACRQMCLHYGVIPRCQPIPEDIRQFTRMADKLIIGSNWAQAGNKVVLVAGEPLGTPGTTNTIIVHTLGAV